MKKKNSTPKSLKKNNFNKKSIMNRLSFSFFICVFYFFNCNSQTEIKISFNDDNDELTFTKSVYQEYSFYIFIDNDCTELVKVSDTVLCLKLLNEEQNSILKSNDFIILKLVRGKQCLISKIPNYFLQNQPNFRLSFYNAESNNFRRFLGETFIKKYRRLGVIYYTNEKGITSYSRQASCYMCFCEEIESKEFDLTLDKEDCLDCLDCFINQNKPN